MLYYSTNHKAPHATLRQAVVQGLASDRGLYMPEVISQLPDTFFPETAGLTLPETACRVADAFFGEDVEATALRKTVCDTLSFDIPLVRVEADIYSLELFHGPTLAFKDVGARFMARLLQHFLHGEQVNVLVATSGDTGSAVANGFLGVDGIHVYVLYPKGKVSAIQESQFTTLGRNITAIEVDGVFDDCQRLVKSAFVDPELNAHMRLTSANSINVARFLPQAFYYFYAYAQVLRNEELRTRQDNVVVCVPSGNFGNICAALFGHAMGLPVKRFIAANNANDVVCQYLRTGVYTPRASEQTIANAMDVGDPSNFARILDLYSRPDVQQRLASRGIAQPMPSLAGGHGSGFITGTTCTDGQIAQTMRECHERTGYVLDPHGAVAYRALREQLREGEAGIFLETAHPAKFKHTVDSILGTDIAIPERLQAFMRGEKQSVPMSNSYDDFRTYLMTR